MAENNARSESMDMDLVDVKVKLMHRFLYQCDSSAMQILLNLYDLEEKIHNIFPSYVSMKNLKRDILFFLRRKDNRVLFAGSLTQAIYDDINRFELAMYLAGYRRGYNDLPCANELEVLALERFGVSDMFDRKVLFHYEHAPSRVRNLKRQALKRELKRKGERLVKDQALQFSKRVLRRKIFTLNHYVDRQLQVNFQSPKTPYRETELMLSRQELVGLNRKLKSFLYRDGLRIYTSAYWCGVNDLVLRRYHP